VRPLEEVARFLGGSAPVEIVAPPSSKEWELSVVVPVEDASDNPDQTDAVEAARISAATRLDALGSDIRAAAGL